MSFLEDIFASLERTESPVLSETYDADTRKGVSRGIVGRDLLKQIAQGRAFLASKNLKRGDRVALLASNSVDWVAADLAFMAEGLVVVPLYSRQAASELVAMMKDCLPSLIICGDAALRDGIVQNWPETPPQFLLDDVFAEQSSRAGVPAPHGPFDPVAIIYTSGTSGEAKGVVLNAGNLAFMLGSTSARLDQLMRGASGQDKVFHYLPFCFAGSWIMLLTCLLRGSRLTINTDLTKLAEQMREAEPDYFLNVPQLLERMRKAVDEQLWKGGGLPLAIYSRAKSAFMRAREEKKTASVSIWLALANAIIFPAIRKKMIGGNLKALICGSAALNLETQLFFMMIGVPVLQVYGLTETTAICTMDVPGDFEPGRVGPSISGIEMKLGDNQEILVRGPNIFSGYWNRPAETEKVMEGGWFHTGDQGEVNAAGNWKITGRIKNLIILGSGHNIAPESIEEEIGSRLPGAQVVLVGNGRSYLSAIVTGARSEQIQLAVDQVNSTLPHYKQVRAYRISAEPFTIENGLLTANGKLKRDAIAQRFRAEVEEMYAVKQAV